MALSSKQLNRATLDRQLLLDRRTIDVVDAVERVGGLQAQEPASPYLALWNRAEGFDPAELDDAFADGRIVKGSLMRLTLHAVTADDHAPLRAAMLPLLRAAGLNDRRFRDTGLSIERADELVDRLAAVADGTVVTRDDLEPVLTEALGEPPAPGLWRAIRFIAPFVHAPTGGAWSFGRTPAFTTMPDGDAPSTDAGLRHLVRRYLAAFGPATVADICRFSMQKRPPVRAAVAAMDDELVRLDGEDGVELLDLAALDVPDADRPAPPRLLPMWDSTLLAYDDRGRVLPETHRAAVIRRNGDVLPAVLVDGHVRGVWRPVTDGIEVTPLERIDSAAWSGLDAEAASLRELLADRDPAAYSRYGNWWSKLPADRRVIG